VTQLGERAGGVLVDTDALIAEHQLAEAPCVRMAAQR
jgi:hypothetical protein